MNYSTVMNMPSIGHNSIYNFQSINFNWLVNGILMGTVGSKTRNRHKDISIRDLVLPPESNRKERMIFHNLCTFLQYLVAIYIGMIETLCSSILSDNKIITKC